MLEWSRHGDGETQGVAQAWDYTYERVSGISGIASSSGCKRHGLSSDCKPTWRTRRICATLVTRTAMMVEADTSAEDEWGGLERWSGGVDWSKWRGGEVSVRRRCIVCIVEHIVVVHCVGHVVVEHGQHEQEQATGSTRRQQRPGGSTKRPSDTKAASLAVSATDSSDGPFPPSPLLHSTLTSPNSAPSRPEHLPGNIMAAAEPTA
jgi:hypothetical protein